MISGAYDAESASVETLYPGSPRNSDFGGHVGIRLVPLVPERVHDRAIKVTRAFHPQEGQVAEQRIRF